MLREQEMSEDIICIDGSQGEGGGQIVRTSLALACVTGRAVRIENVRAGRPKPGLSAQHVSCVRAACEISSGDCVGNEKGSKLLEFRPGEIAPGNYHFDIGTAGACSLVIQTLLPALFFAKEPSRVTVSGGTHNPFAPPFDFLYRTFFPRLGDFGLQAQIKLLRYGFYPAGGGVMQVDVQPGAGKGLVRIDFTHRSRGVKLNAVIYTSQLPDRVAELQRKLLMGSGLPFQQVRHIDVKDSAGPGNCVIAEFAAGEHTTVFSAFGRRGKHSKKVIAELVDLTQRFIDSAGAVDHFLADQLLLYMALAGGGRLTTETISSHCRTNMEVIQAFLPVDFSITQLPRAWELFCTPR